MLPTYFKYIPRQKKLSTLITMQILHFCISVYFSGAHLAPVTERSDVRLSRLYRNVKSTHNPPTKKSPSSTVILVSIKLDLSPRGCLTGNKSCITLCA